MNNKHRPMLRQQMINEWFHRFVEHELYDESQYHDFCKRVRDMSHFEIQRMFKLESK